MAASGNDLGSVQDSAEHQPSAGKMHVELLNGDTLTISMDDFDQPGVTGAHLKSQIMECPEAADCTNFQLVKKTDDGDYVMLQEQAQVAQFELNDGCTVQMVPMDWNRRTARLHLRRVRHLLTHGLPVSLASAADKLQQSGSGNQQGGVPIPAATVDIPQRAPSSAVQQAPILTDGPSKSAGIAATPPAPVSKTEPKPELASTALASAPVAATDASSVTSSTSTVSGSTLLHNLLRQQMQLTDTTSWLPTQELPLRPDPSVFVDNIPPVLTGRGDAEHSTAAPGSTSVTGVLRCLKSITYSGFNPPPPKRAMVGDLMYVDVETHEGQYVCVTASTTGWFVNSTLGPEYGLQPTPSHHGSNAPSLVALLKHTSPSFAKGYAVLLQEAAATARHLASTAVTPWDAMFELGLVAPGATKNKPGGDWARAGVDTYGPASCPSFSGSISSIGSGLAFGRAPWVVHPGGGQSEHGTIQGHAFDPQRAEDDLTSAFGMDERGTLRDWNDELQACREFECSGPQEAAFRARAYLKVCLDFVEAAVQGVLAIAAGHILSLNPGDNPGQQVFVYNSIFFSFALTPDERMGDLRRREEGAPAGAGTPPHKSGEGGGPLCLDVDVPPDAASVSASNHDLRMLRHLQVCDLGDLRTLATVIVEHMGQRYVAQSIIPGILQGEQVSTLLYGSVNNGVTVAHDAGMHAAMQLLGQQLHVAERLVKPLGHAAQVTGSLTPLDRAKDAQGVEIVSVGNGGRASTAPVRMVGPVECKGITGSDGRKYVLDLVRLTPLDLLWLREQNVWLHSGTTAGALYPSSKNSTPRDGTQILPNVVPDNGSGYLPMLRPELVQSFAKHCAEQGRPVPEFNVNVGTRFHELSGDSEEQRSADEDLVRAAGAYLREVVLPRAAAQLVAHADSIVDGEALTDFLHARGVNMRYLGRIANILLDMERQTDCGAGVPAFLLPLVEAEIVARCAVSRLKTFLQQVATTGGAPYLVAVFLNALLGKPAPLSRGKGGGSSGARHSTGNEHSPALPKAWCSSIASAMSKQEQWAEQGGNPAQQMQAPAHVLGVVTVDQMQLTHNTVWMMISFNAQSHFGYTPLVWQDGGYQVGGGPELRSAHEALTGSRPPLPADEGVPLPAGALPMRSRLHRLGLMKRISQKMGVQLSAFPASWDSTRPVAVEDIEAFVPVVKHCVPERALEGAHALLEGGRRLLRSKQFADAFDATNEAMGMVYQVAGAAHPDIAACCSQLSLIMWQCGDKLGAVAQAQRALLLLRRLRGADHPSVIKAHDTLAALLAGAGLVKAAVAQYRTAGALLEAVAGPFHPACVSTYVRMGMLYHDVRHPLMAIKCFKVAQARCTDPAQGAACHHAVAMAHCSVSNFKGALDAEKRARACYLAQGAAGEAAAAKATAWMKRFTQKALAMRSEMAQMPEGVRLSTQAFIDSIHTGAAQEVAMVLDAAERVKGGAGGVDAAPAEGTAGAGAKSSGKRRRRRGGAKS